VRFSGALSNSSTSRVFRQFLGAAATAQIAMTGGDARMAIVRASDVCVDGFDPMNPASSNQADSTPDTRLAAAHGRSDRTVFQDFIGGHRPFSSPQNMEDPFGIGTGRVASGASCGQFPA